jgi:hypothetical protein
MDNDDPIKDPTLTNQIEEDATTGAALDEAFSKFSSPDETPPEGTGEVTAGETGEGEGEGEGEQPNTEQTLPEEQAAPGEQQPETKSRIPAQDAAPAVDDEENDPILKALNAVKLRSDASQKTKDTFANLKQLSAEGLRAARAETARLKAEQQAAIDAARAAAIEEAKKSVAVPEDVQKELEELRTLRARVDVESDPQFKQKFDERRDKNFETIYGVLKAHSLPESQLKILRALGPAERVEEITSLASKLPSSSKLKIEAKLFENLNLDDERERALAEARTRSAEIFAEKEKTSKEQQAAQLKAKQEAVEQFKTQSVFQRVDIPATAAPEERKRLEAANAEADRLQKLYEETVNDETPLAKAEAAFGLVLAHKFKSELDSTKAKLEAAQKELTAIKKRSGVTDKGRIVNVPDTTRPAVTLTDAGSALDAFARERGLL